MIEACSNGAVKREGKRGSRRALARVMCYIYPVARHGEDWNENRIGVPTRGAYVVGVREEQRKRTGGKREGEGLGREGRGKGGRARQGWR